MQDLEQYAELNGFGNPYTTQFRQYDPRLGRRFSARRVCLNPDFPDERIYPIWTASRVDKLVGLSESEFTDFLN